MLHGVAFHGQAAACKFFIGKYDDKQTEWGKAHFLFWNDKSHTSAWQTGGQVWVWWMLRECYLPDWIVPTVKFGGAGIIEWGCFWFQWRKSTMLQHTKAFCTIVCFQLCGNSLQKALFCCNMTVPQCMTQRLDMACEFGVKEPDGLIHLTVKHSHWCTLWKSFPDE